jgi:biopolymer transport protein ExbD
VRETEICPAHPAWLAIRFERKRSRTITDEETSPMRNNQRRKSEESEVNMTPMLDVVFIMLIFFIVTASFVKEAGVDVNRPPALTAISKDKGNILIAITENGQIWIDRRQVDPRSLRANIERLHGENPQGAIVIQADKNSQNHLLVAVMDAAKSAGVNQIAIAAEGS